MKKKFSILWIILVLMFLYLPILILAVYSFTKSTTIGALRGFSIGNYRTLFTTPELRGMILGTMGLAVLVSFISTILGTVGAVGVFYSKKGTRSVMELVNQIPVVNADVVTGFSVCVLLIIFLGLDKNTYIPLVAGLTSLCTPFVYLSVTPRLKQMDPNLYEAALDLGCTPVRALLRVVFPELIPGILSGFMTSITLTLDDYFITTYTKPAVFDTISTYVVNATKGAQTHIKTALWALSTVIFVVVIIAVILMNMTPDGVNGVRELVDENIVKRRRKAREERKLLNVSRSRKGNSINTGSVKKGSFDSEYSKGSSSKSGSSRNSMKSLALIMAIIGACLLSCTGCGKTKDKTLVLRIANCEEYIDEGNWDETVELDNGTVLSGETSIIEDFEKWYEKTYGEKVKVEYSTYGTNEELYNQLTLGNEFDLVCPSEYMIMKFMEEKRLLPYSDEFFDTALENNYYAKGVSPYIQSVLDELNMEGEPVSRYGAGYMWGNMGIVYNPELTDSADFAHWDGLLNSKYEKRITMKDGVRDSYFIALSIMNADELQKDEFIALPDYKDLLAEMLNDTSEKTVDKAENILSDMRRNAYSLESDSGKADMITGKVVANMQWSGDAVYTMDQAEEDGVFLEYSVPKECTNMWFDAWVMLKDCISQDARKQRAAEAFVNFISRPDNVVRNMYYIGYTSAIAGGEDDTVFEYLEYCYGAEDEEEAVSYPLGYFFNGLEGAEDEDYILMTDKEQLKRQLFAQYPPLDTIRRSAVMKPYSKEANKRIGQMWINIRCFDFK